MELQSGTYEDAQGQLYQQHLQTPTSRFEPRVFAEYNPVSTRCKCGYRTPGVATKCARCNTQIVAGEGELPAPRYSANSTVRGGVSAWYSER